MNNDIFTQTFDQPKEGSLRVWHIPQVPGQPFYVPVPTPSIGKVMMDILAAYDIFQYEQRVKPDFANANGLEVFEGGEWITWHDEEGNDIDELEFNQKGELVPAWMLGEN